MIDAIGGYFGLADRDLENGTYPVNGARTNTARNALEYILRLLPDVKRVYLPLYTCDAVLEPLKKLAISFTFYHINMRLEKVEEINTTEGEYIIINNYFGIKDEYIGKMVERYGDHLIVDNSQALFSMVHPDVKAIYSPRKFVGVADGGFAHGISDLELLLYDLDITEHDSHLTLRKEKGAEAGFRDFQENESKLDNQPIRRMAYSTQDILCHIDYKLVIEKRRENFEMLHSALGSQNLLSIPDMNTFCCPMIYPFLTDDRTLRWTLRTSRIYVAQYWKNVMNWCGPHYIEYILSEKLLPLPIDQRYGKEHINNIIDLIK